MKSDNTILKRRPTNLAKKTRINGAIRATQLRVIDAENNQLGVISKEEAIQAAQDAGLDLVEVSPQADPPVARIIDWGKYNYQKTKQQNKQKRKSANDLKQIRFGLKIGEHDMDIKLRKIREFLEAGHKVRVTAFYRGRENAHRELGYQLLDKVTQKLEDVAVVDQEPQLQGKQLSMTIRKGSRAKA